MEDLQNKREMEFQDEKSMREVSETSKQKRYFKKIERKIEELDYSEGRRKWLKFFTEFQDYMKICC